MNIDVAIIGAGIVGLATAIEMKKRFPEKSVVVFERHAEAFGEASRHNSGVIHSGIHQKAEFLKSKLALTGGPMLVKFCEEHGVPIVKRGMAIVVSGGDMVRLIQESKSLWMLYRNSRRAKIPLKFLTGRALRKMEPNIHGVFALYLPNVWVVDQVRLAKAFEAEAMRLGVKLCYDTILLAVDRHPNVYALTTTRGAWYAKTVVNAAGVCADNVAALAGFTNYKVYPYRGEYYEIVGEKAKLNVFFTLTPEAVPKVQALSMTVVQNR